MVHPIHQKIANKEFLAVVVSANNGEAKVRVLYWEGVSKVMTIHEFFKEFGYDEPAYPRAHPYVNEWLTAADLDWTDQIEKKMPKLQEITNGGW